MVFSFLATGQGAGDDETGAPLSVGVAVAEGHGEGGAAVAAGRAEGVAGDNSAIDGATI
jgi:hypothetical protein